MMIQKTLLQLLLVSFLVPTAFAASAPEFSSVYTQVNDKTKCKYRDIKGGKDGPDSCEYDCDGPAPGVKTRLLSCYDYESLFLSINGKEYSTWDAMMKQGAFSGIGNRKGIVEWLTKVAKPTRANEVLGFIVRFEGSQVNAEGVPGAPKSALAVFDLRDGQVCWLGNFATNELARKAFGVAPCKQKLESKQL